jgi:hypothetical protein
MAKIPTTGGVTSRTALIQPFGGKLVTTGGVFLADVLAHAEAMTVSPHLDHSLRYTITPHADLGLPKQYPPHVVREAQAALRALQPLMEPIKESQLRAWLLPVPAACSNVPDAASVHGLVAAVMLISAQRGIPTCALNQRSQATLLAGLKWWPSSGEIVDLLAADVGDLARTWSALQRIAAFQPKLVAA